MNKYIGYIEMGIDEAYIEKYFDTVRNIVLEFADKGIIGILPIVTSKGLRLAPVFKYIGKKKREPYKSVAVDIALRRLEEYAQEKLDELNVPEGRFLLEDSGKPFSDICIFDEDVDTPFFLNNEVAIAKVKTVYTKTDTGIKVFQNENENNIVWVDVLQDAFILDKLEYKNTKFYSQTPYEIFMASLYERFDYVGIQLTLENQIKYDAIRSISKDATVPYSESCVCIVGDSVRVYLKESSLIELLMVVDINKGTSLYKKIKCTSSNYSLSYSGLKSSIEKYNLTTGIPNLRFGTPCSFPRLNIEQNNLTRYRG